MQRRNCAIGSGTVALGSFVSRRNCLYLGLGCGRLAMSDVFASMSQHYFWVSLQLPTVKIPTLKADVPLLDSSQRDQAHKRETRRAGDPPISQKRQVCNISGKMYAIKH